MKKKDDNVWKSKRRGIGAALKWANAHSPSSNENLRWLVKMKGYSKLDSEFYKHKFKLSFIEKETNSAK